MVADSKYFSTVISSNIKREVFSFISQEEEVYLSGERYNSLRRFISLCVSLSPLTRLGHKKSAMFKNLKLGEVRAGNWCIPGTLQGDQNSIILSS